MRLTLLLLRMPVALSSNRPEDHIQSLIFACASSLVPRARFKRQRLRLQLDEVESNLKDPRRFGAALTILQAQDFQKKDIKRVFNAYSDNIYYLPDSDRENKYLQGGATPSSRQTLQYLLRNDVIDNVEALTAEIAYLIRERESGGEDGSEVDTDEKDLRMYLGKCKQSFDKYLGMVFQNEIDEATDMAKLSLASKRKGNAPAPEKTP